MQIRRTLEQWVDLSSPAVSEALIKQFALPVAVVDDNSFQWILNFSGGDGKPRLTPGQIAQKHYYEALHGEPDTDLDPRLNKSKEILSFTLAAEDAAAYGKSIGLKFFAKKWHDKTVIISI